jgi:hypothetical protein
MLAPPICIYCGCTRANRCGGGCTAWSAGPAPRCQRCLEAEQIAELIATAADRIRGVAATWRAQPFDLRRGTVLATATVLDVLTGEGADHLEDRPMSKTLEECATTDEAWAVAHAHRDAAHEGDSHACVGCVTCTTIEARIRQLAAIEQRLGQAVDAACPRRD